MKELSGKVALITGAAGGIGLGIARAVAAEGMQVVLSDIDQLELEQAVTALRSEGAAVSHVRLDVTDRRSWTTAAERIIATVGHVQLLVNNAGVSTSGMPFTEVAPQVWDRVVGINLTGAFNGIHQFLPSMLSLGTGHIVNTSSLAGLIPGPVLGPYAATKAGLIGLSEALRAELADSGIGVTVLCPGGVRSRLWKTSRAARWLPEIDVPPMDVSGQSARAEMLPDEVGLLVLQAVLNDEPYVITHPEYATGVAERHQRLMQAFEWARTRLGEKKTAEPDTQESGASA